jgi:hypothetical protein
VDPEKAAFWADSQVPQSIACFSGAIREPAWRTKPSWYLVATEDKRIPPDALYFSRPKAVAALIEQAASKDKGTAVA